MKSEIEELKSVLTSRNAEFENTLSKSGISGTERFIALSRQVYNLQLLLYLANSEREQLRDDVAKLNANIERLTNPEAGEVPYPTTAEQLAAIREQAIESARKYEAAQTQRITDKQTPTAKTPVASSRTPKKKNTTK